MINKIKMKKNKSPKWTTKTTPFLPTTLFLATVLITFSPLFALGIVPTPNSDFAAVISTPAKRGQDEATTAPNSLIRFEPFRRTEQYRCGQFAENNKIDPATRIIHQATNLFIEKLSKPFPHEKLLTSEALLGKPSAWKTSFLSQRNIWLDYQFNWAVVCGLLVLCPALFTVLYLLYRCCVCCCCGSDDEDAKPVQSRYDSCKRIFLTALISLFIITNVFCSVVFFHNLYYAKSELDEFPTQIHLCANDFTIYKSETNERVRKLLRDDFFLLNSTLHRDFDSVGDSIVTSLKKSTGASLIDEIIAKTKGVEPLRRRYNELASEVPQIYGEVDSLQQRLANNKRLQVARSDFLKCEQQSSASSDPPSSFSKGGDKEALCYAARQALQALITPDGTRNIPSEQQRQEQMAQLLPEEIPTKLDEIMRLDVEARFAPSVDAIDLLRKEIQNRVDNNRGDAVEGLKSLDNTLFRLYEDISATVKSVDLRFLDEQVVDPMMRYRDQYRHYIHYGFIAALVIGGIIGFIAGLFLLGLFFGCCGRRPNDYDYDCCVFSTASKLFNFGSWLCLLFLLVFGIVTATLMFVGANLNWLACQPMRDPLSRPDILSLLDRMVEVYGLDGTNRPPSQSHQNSQQTLSVYDVFTPERRPVDLIRGCIRGKTLYTLLGLDKKFKLADNVGTEDEYQSLNSSIRRFLSQPMFRHSARDIRLYGGDVAVTLAALARVQLPRVNASAVEQFCSLRLMFQVDQVLADIRAQRQTMDGLKATSSSGGSGGPSSPIPELDAVIQQLESFHQEATRLRQRIDATCSRLGQFKRDIDSLSFFNETALSTRIERANALLSAENLNKQLREAADSVARDFAGKIQSYAQHVNHSMISEVSSCAPIVDIARNVRIATCDYTLDRLNMIWMAMTLTLLLYIPLVIWNIFLANYKIPFFVVQILLTRCLTPLYNKSYTPLPPYPIYTGNPHDATFATDIYESRNGLLSNGSGGMDSPSRQPTMKISHPLHTALLASPYASTTAPPNGGGAYGNYNNYNYELYPPTYMSNNHHGR